MKANFYLLGLGLILFACGSNKSEPAELPDAEINMWKIDQDSTGNLVMQKTIAPEMDTLTAENIISYLNNNNPSVKLDYVKTSGDTLFLKIADANYLTQQMGSSGSTVYMAEVVYNFTELPGIRLVSFDFQEGDHAQPGIYTRESFKDN
ncbi:MAG: hypothetical protein HYZ15_10615 [Sphingobacteriales bacterium]|nr:hypothetical protein [Sphingobacteriales bacterium]